jgi:hypothetical protein
VDEIEATDLVVAPVDRCYTQLVRYTVRSVIEHDLAEELEQDAFVQNNLATVVQKAEVGVSTNSRPWTISPPKLAPLCPAALRFFLLHS